MSETSNFENSEHVRSIERAVLGGLMQIDPIRPEKVKTIEQIWYGEDIDFVRTKHSKNSLEEVQICKGCPFKETYDWQKVN